MSAGRCAGRAACGERTRQLISVHVARRYAAGVMLACEHSCFVTVNVTVNYIQQHCSTLPFWMPGSLRPPAPVCLPCLQSNPEVQAFMAAQQWGDDYARLEGYYLQQVGWGIATWYSQA